MISEDKWYTDNEFEGLEEIGGRCDMVYRCDACEECEYYYDEHGEISSMTKIFRVGDDDLCEWCIRHGRKPQ